MGGFCSTAVSPFWSKDWLRPPIPFCFIGGEQLEPSSFEVLNRTFHESRNGCITRWCFNHFPTSSPFFGVYIQAKKMDGKKNRDMYSQEIEK